MIALCIEDEALLLEALLWAVRQSPDITLAVGFSDEEQALAWAENHTADVVFTDVELRRLSGLEVAARLREKDPLLPVIFCTGHQEYALSALRMHADGYLLKPVDPEEVQKELDRLKLTGRAGRVLLSVRCRGGFDVRDARNHPISFRRSRSEELLALLIHYGGAPLTVDQMCGRLWPDQPGMLGKNRNYLRQLLSDLRAALQGVGAEQAVRHGPGGYYADLALIRVEDRGLAGQPYLPCFAWANQETNDEGEEPPQQA